LKNKEQPDPYRALLFVPGTLVDKWKREIKERIPDCRVYEITHFSDVLKLRNKPYRPDKIEYYVMSSEIVKKEYSMSPIEDWRTGASAIQKEMEVFREITEKNSENHQKYKPPKVRLKRNEVIEGSRELFVNYSLNDLSGFHCPQCGNFLSESEHFFQHKSGKKWINKIKHANYKCTNEIKTKYLPKHLVKDPNEEYQECGYVLWQPERLPLHSKQRKVSPAWAINKFLRRGFFKYLIADEVHEYKSSDSNVGQAFGQLINHTEKQILLTGTLIGGMAKDLFYLLAKLNAKRLLKEGITYQDENLFVSRYGVFETKYEDNDSIRRVKGRTQKPGISPHLFPLYLMNNCVFLELADLGYVLPPYQEIPVFIEMNHEHKKHYNQLEEEIGKRMRYNAFLGNMNLISTYINTLYQYSDLPWNFSDIVLTNKHGRQQVIARPFNFDPNEFVPEKLNKLDEILHDEIYNQGRKVLVYTKYTGTNAYNQVDAYLYRKLKEKGYNVGILRSSGSFDGIKMPKSTQHREKWIKDMMEKHDWDVLITNPRLVKVGLDLLQFPTIVYYQMDYSTYDYMQSSRRSWRIKQTEPVKVYTLVYADTIQSEVLNHIAKKIDAAMAMQGKFSEEGLRAMAESEDGMNALAKNLLKEGKLDNIETIHDRFQRLNQSYEEMQMAKYEEYEHYEVNPIEGGLETVLRIANEKMANLERKISNESVNPADLIKYTEILNAMIQVVDNAKEYNKGLRKKEKVIEGQLALDIF